MARSPELGAALRFGVGALLSVLVGLALFRLDTFEPGEPWFQCVTGGALLAGLLTLVRISRAPQAVSLTLAFILVHVGYAWTLGVGRAIVETLWSIALGGGLLVSALVFHNLAEKGYRFGKFALLGPLVAGVYLASTLLILLRPELGDPMATLVRHVFVGLVIGDAVGLGIELVELFPSFATETSRFAGPS